MSAESLSVWDRAVADLTAAGAIVEPCAPTVTRATVRTLFTEAAKARGDVAPNANSPAATANALFRYFSTHGDEASARRDVERGLAAYRAFYDVLPKDWEEMSKLIVQPYERDPAGVSFARSRETAIAQLAETFRAQKIDAMIYPTMPFPAPRAVDAWPDVRTTLETAPGWPRRHGSSAAPRTRDRSRVAPPRRQPARCQACRFPSCTSQSCDPTPGRDSRGRLIPCARIALRRCIAPKEQ